MSQRVQSLRRQAMHQSWTAAAHPEHQGALQREVTVVPQRQHVTTLQLQTTHS